MGCDTVVALGRATVDGHTLLAHNSDRSTGECEILCHVRGQAHAFGETVRTQHLVLPQARQTFTVLGQQPQGLWGYSHGVNEHGVAIGHSGWHSKFQGDKPGLLGSDLVRLALERSRTACQAVDLLTELLEHHGQGGAGATDTALLVADAREAYALECAGPYWVLQQIQEVRASSNVSIVRQDWYRIAPGLSSHALAQGWWPSDGSKLDFAGAVSANPVGDASALRRWGRATMLLEEQSGHIDAAFLRRLLSDHYEGMQSEVDPLRPETGPTPLCKHAPGLGTVSSMVVRLSSDPTHLVAPWCAFGPPCLGVYFPIFLDGDVPRSFTHGGAEPALDSFWWRIHEFNQSLGADPQRWAQVRSSFSFLQARIDQETEEFAEEAANLKQRGELTELQRLAGIFMQHNLEQFETVMDSVRPVGARWAAVVRH